MLVAFRSIVIWFDLLCLTPLSAIFQLYHGDQFWWWKYPERTTNHWQTTGKLYHLRLRVECTLFVIYKVGRKPTVLVIGLYELLGNPTASLIGVSLNPSEIFIRCSWKSGVKHHQTKTKQTKHTSPAWYIMTVNLCIIYWSNKSVDTIFCAHDACLDYTHQHYLL